MIVPVPILPARLAPPVYTVSRIPVPGDGGWDYLAFEPGTPRLFLSRGDRVDVLNVDSGKVVGTIPGLKGVHGVAFAPALGRGFVSCGRSNEVLAFDLKTLKPLGTAPTGGNPDAILFEPKTGRVLTFNGGGENATAIDARTLGVVGTLPLGGKPEFAATDGAGTVWVNMEESSEVAQLDAKALKETRRWKIAPAEGPSGLAYDPKAARLYSVCGNGLLAVSDARKGSLALTLPIGRGPDACAFYGRTGTVYASNGEGTLTVLSTKAGGPAETVPTLPGARTMALDARTGAVYTCTAETLPAPAAPPNGEAPRRRGYKPGTFVVLRIRRG